MKLKLIEGAAVVKFVRFQKTISLENKHKKALTIFSFNDYSDFALNT
jgi:hypothetical protein